MEMELKKISLDNFRTAGEVTFSQEENTETIVPDYCPDIARIVKTDGTVHIHSRELRDGKAEIAGTVKATVLYVPDGEQGIRALEVTMPFRMESEHRFLHGCQYIVSLTEIETLESRTLNPRKVFTRCKLISKVAGYRKEAIVCSTDLLAEDSQCIEKRKLTQRAVLITQICEKDYTFTGTATLSPGRDGAAEVLSHRIGWTVSEKKIVGTKLVFKGVFSVRILYRNTEGICCAFTGELPFSQIMELDREAEHADTTLDIQITGADVQISGDDPEGREFSVTLYFHGTALLREEQEITILNDLYSTSYELTYDAEPLSTVEMRNVMTRRHMIREVVETGVEIEGLICVDVQCGAVSVNREGKHVSLKTGAAIKLLYSGEGGTPLAAERVVEAGCQLELPEEYSVKAEAICCEEVQGSVGERGIEVRVPIDFRIEVEKTAKIVCISRAVLDENEKKDTGIFPSIILRCIGKQENAWDLAKKYNTTIPLILAANQLEEEPLPQGSLLLIPRKRG